MEPRSTQTGAFQAIAEPLVAMLMAIALTLFLTLLAVPAAAGAEFDLLDVPPGMLPLLLGIQSVVFLATGSILAWIRLREPPANRSSLPRALLAGCAGGAVALVSGAAISSLLSVVGLPVEEQEWLQHLFQNRRTVLLLAPWLILIGPFAEEVFFRRYAYRAIARRHGVSAGVLLSALMFATVHFNLSGFLIYLVIGVTLAWVYERTGRLSASLTAHVLVNSAALVQAVFFSG